MTHKEATKRNSIIRQLRATTSLITSQGFNTIAKDFKGRTELVKLSQDLSQYLDDIKIKRYTCSNCNDTTTLHLTTSSRATSCDFCNNWSNTTGNLLKLYNYKE